MQGFPIKFITLLNRLPKSVTLPHMDGKNTDSLSNRAQHILRDVVDLYAETGTPVGSKLLAERGSIGMSPATMRNVMRDLEMMGLLTHPHTSAGRMPTAEGYRFYAKNLVQVDDISKGIKEKLKASVEEGKDIGDIVTNVSNTLGELTSYAGLVSAPKHVEDPLEQVEFLRLSGDKVLVVMVAKSGRIENRVIDVPDFVSVDDLNKAGQDLKKAIAGQTLKDAKSDMLANLAEQKGRINEVIDQMMSAAHEWGEPTISDGALVVAGSTNLFQYPELVRERLQGLIGMFEEKRLLMALMEQVEQGEGVQVFVGQDSPLQETEDCAVIASSYGTADKKVVGTLGVIGPMRMDYKQTIGLVDYTARLLSEAIEERG